MITEVFHSPGARQLLSLGGDLLAALRSLHPGSGGTLAGHHLAMRGERMSKRLFGVSWALELKEGEASEGLEA